MQSTRRSNPAYTKEGLERADPQLGLEATVNDRTSGRRHSLTNEGFALALFNAGNIYLQQRQLVQAREFYGRALGADAMDESTLSSRALVNTLLGDHTRRLPT